MNDWIPVILFILGLILIISGSGWFIDSTIWIAKVLKVPNLIIGATLVSLCTTLPEAMVSGSSAIKGNADIAFGNAMGSIAFNTGFILSLTMILIQPKLTEKKKLRKNSLILFFIFIVLTVFSILFDALTRITGILFLGMVVLYIYSNVLDAKMDSRSRRNKYERVAKDKKTIVKNIFLFIIGIVFTIYGANLLVSNGEIIAKILGVPDVIIGLTLTAFGTSLPELVTSITSIIKKAHDISIGNIIGANILNIILVLGISSSILPIKIQNSYLTTYIPFTFAIIALVVFFIFANRTRLKRWNGIIVMGLYFTYVYFMFFKF